MGAWIREGSGVRIQEVCKARVHISMITGRSRTQENRRTLVREVPIRIDNPRRIVDGYGIGYGENREILTRVHLVTGDDHTHVKEMDDRKSIEPAGDIKGFRYARVANCIGGIA